MVGVYCLPCYDGLDYLWDSGAHNEYKKEEVEVAGFGIFPTLDMLLFYNAWVYS